jgi:hypothetical protein
MSRPRRRRRWTAETLIHLGGALAVPSLARGLEPLEVKNDNTGQHCASMAQGGCLVHFEGSLELTNHVLGFGIHEMSCTTEIELEADEDGAVAVTSLRNGNPGDANCATIMPACGLPWSGAAEETGIRRIHGLDLCRRPC